MDKLETIRYDMADNTITILDQTRLPNALVYKRLQRIEEVYGAIKTLEVRGAPLIGVVCARIAIDGQGRISGCCGAGKKLFGKRAADGC